MMLGRSVCLTIVSASAVLCLTVKVVASEAFFLVPAPGAAI